DLAGRVQQPLPRFVRGRHDRSPKQMPQTLVLLICIKQVFGRQPRKDLFLSRVRAAPGSDEPGTGRGAGGIMKGVAGTPSPLPPWLAREEGAMYYTATRRAMADLTPIQSLIATGTKVWLDSVDPEQVAVNRRWGVTGATSNPIIVADLVQTGRFD